MSNSRNFLSDDVARNSSALDTPNEGVLAEVEPLLRAAITRAIRESNLSRFQVAAQISEYIQREITKNYLDKILSNSCEEARVAADLVAAVCLATGSVAPLEILAAAVGAPIMNAGEAKQFELWRLKEERANLDEKIKKLERKSKK